jgi:hypothetical protein
MSDSLLEGLTACRAIVGFDPLEHLQACLTLCFILLPRQEDCCL